MNVAACYAIHESKSFRTKDIFFYAHTRARVYKIFFCRSDGTNNNNNNETIIIINKRKAAKKLGRRGDGMTRAKHPRNVTYIFFYVGRSASAGDGRGP